MDTEFETLLYREENRVAYVTLNRPEVQNSFDYVMIDELAQVWQALRSNDDVRAVVLTGAGDKAFCTGNDRSTIPFDVKWDPYTYDDPGVSIGPRVNRMWKPVIAAVNGTAAAGAFYLLGQVDFIIAADHATFVDPHVTYAMPAVYEPIEALAKMPFGEAMRVALLGRQRAHVGAARLRDRVRERGRPAGGADGRGHVGGRGHRRTTAGGDHGDVAHALGRARDVPVAGHRAREHVPAPRHGHRQGEPEGGRGDVRQPPAHQAAGALAAVGSVTRPASPSGRRAVAGHHRAGRHDRELGDGEIRVRQQHRHELGDRAAEVVGLHVVLVDHDGRQPLREQRRRVLDVEVAGEVGAQGVADGHADEAAVGSLHRHARTVRSRAALLAA